MFIARIGPFQKEGQVYKHFVPNGTTNLRSILKADHLIHFSVPMTSSILRSSAVSVRKTSESRQP